MSRGDLIRAVKFAETKSLKTASLDTPYTIFPSQAYIFFFSFSGILGIIGPHFLSYCCFSPFQLTSHDFVPYQHCFITSKTHVSVCIFPNPPCLDFSKTLSHFHSHLRQAKKSTWKTYFLPVGREITFSTL